MQRPHFHLTATADDGTRAEHLEGAYLPALGLARRLVQEARLAGGTVTYDPMTGDAPFCIGLWLVRDGESATTASIASRRPPLRREPAAVRVHQPTDLAWERRRVWALLSPRADQPVCEALDVQAALDEDRGGRGCIALPTAARRGKLHIIAAKLHITA